MRRDVIEAFAGGLIGGAVAGVCGCYFYMKDKCEQFIDEEIADYKARMKREKTFSDTSVATLEVSLDDGKEGEIRPGSTLDSLPKYQTAADDREDYTKYYEDSDLYKEKSPIQVLAEREHPEDSDEDGVDEELVNEEGYEEGLIASSEHERVVMEGVEPVEITQYAFEEEKFFDKQFIYYWLNDDILADADDQVISDWEKTIGNCLDKGGWLDRARRDPDTEEKLYIRNHIFEVDYCLEAVNGAFYETH